MKTRFPSPDKLAKALGIAMPTSWASFMEIAHTHARTRAGMETYFEDALTLIFSGPSLRAWGIKADADDGSGYTHCPPEFVELGGMGVDGVSYGLTVRTPEAPETEPPLAQFSPIDDDPLVLLGPTAAEAIENLVAEAIANREEDGPSDEEGDAESIALKLKQIGNALGFTPSGKHAHRRYDKAGNGRPIPVKPRKGYHYAETCDGVGVHAPDAAFDRSKSAPSFDEAAPIKTLVKRASASLRAGFPATALAIAKSAWWCHYTTADACTALGPILVEAYTSLRRPTYAEFAARQAEKGRVFAEMMEQFSSKS